MLTTHYPINASQPKKRGPKTKVHRGPLPEHLKLLARLCVKHDGPVTLRTGTASLTMLQSKANSS